MNRASSHIVSDRALSAGALAQIVGATGRAAKLGHGWRVCCFLLSCPFGWGCAENAPDSAKSPDVAPFASESAASGPLVCDEPLWDVGEVLADTRHSHVFRLANRGPTELVIRHVQGDCGCLVTTTERKAIPPGETFDVNVTFDVPPAAGPLRHAISVATEKSHEESLKLLVRGEVQPNPGLFTPTREVDFGRVSGSTLVRRTLVVARHDGSPVRFLDVRSDHEALTRDGDVRPVATLRGAVAVPLAIAPDRLPAGRGTFSIKVRTEHTGVFAELPVSARVMKESGGPLVELVSVAGLRAGTPRRVAIVRGGGKTRPEVVEARFKGDAPITASVIRGSDGAFSGEVEFALDAALAPPEGPRLVEGVLEVVLAKTKAPVSIPTRVLILAAAGDAVAKKDTEKKDAEK